MGKNSRQAKAKGTAVLGTTVERHKSPSETFFDLNFEPHADLYADEDDYDDSPSDLEDLLRGTVPDTVRRSRRKIGPHLRASKETSGETNDDISKAWVESTILGAIEDLKNDKAEEKGNKPIEDETYCNPNCDINAIAGLNGDTDNGDRSHGLDDATQNLLQQLLDIHENEIVDRITTLLQQKGHITDEVDDRRRRLDEDTRDLLDELLYMHEDEIVDKITKLLRHEGHATERRAASIEKWVKPILAAIAELKVDNKRLHKENAALRDANMMVLQAVQANARAIADLAALVGRGRVTTPCPTTPPPPPPATGAGNTDKDTPTTTHRVLPAERGVPGATVDASRAGAKRSWEPAGGPPATQRTAKAARVVSPLPTLMNSEHVAPGASTIPTGPSRTWDTTDRGANWSRTPGNRRPFGSGQWRGRGWQGNPGAFGPGRQEGSEGRGRG